MSISPLKGSFEYGIPRASRSTTRLGQQQQQQTTKCSISLEKVIGNTVNASTGFDSNPDGAFAVCSGSTAVVSRVLHDQTIKQQVYRAPPRTASDQITGVELAPNSPFRTKGRQGPRASILPGTPVSPDGKDLSAKTAVHRKPKGTSCLALSSNGQFLAVGETGYAPRILLFSLATDSDTPISVASEHISGIQTLSFSPDSKWLCSVGDTFDGCIYIWSVSHKGVLKLHASSKCTSTVNDTKWVDRRSIITAGVRHLKIWRPDISSQPPSPLKSILSPRIRTRQDSPVPASPGPISLSGRNVLLGDLLESSFTTICSISETEAIIGSDFGDITAVNIAQGTQKLEWKANLGAPIKCIVLDAERRCLFVATSNAKLWFSILSKELTKASPTHPNGPFKSLDVVSYPLAMAIVEDKLLSIDERRYLSVYTTDDLLSGSNQTPIQIYPTHSVAANGCTVSSQEKGGLITYDASGHIIRWDSTFVCKGQFNVDVEIRSPSLEYEGNELKVVKESQIDGYKVCGDRYGVLSLFNSAWELLDVAQAHTSDVNDILVIETPVDPLAITCGRDRAIQAFRINSSKLELFQTIDQHNGAVNKLEVIEQDGTLVLSLSSDRTILVHKLIHTSTSQALLCVKIITLKATPLACAFDGLGSNLLNITTADKQLHIIQLKTGLLENSVRIVDDEDQIALQYILIRSVGNEDRPLKLLIGISNADKTLRVHNAQSGEMLCKAGGHSESITSLTILEENTLSDGSLTLKLVTTSLDGTIMLWKLDCPVGTRDTDSKDLMNSRDFKQTPLRKVLSKSRLAGFAATLDPSEWSPLPSPTRERPFRNTSPDRLHRRTSVPNLLRDSPTPILSPPMPRRQISPGPDVSSNSRRRTLATRSESSAIEDLDVLSSSKALLSSLRNFRLNFRAHHSDLDAHLRDELKLELKATLDALKLPRIDKDDFERNDSYFSALNGVQNMTINETEDGQY